MSTDASSLTPDRPRFLQQPFRLDLVFYSSRYLSVSDITGIATYLQIPPQALINSVEHFEGHHTSSPARFKVMCRMMAPPDSPDEFMMGVIVLPQAIHEGRHLMEAYRKELEQVQYCALHGQPPILSRARQIMDAQTDIRAVVDLVNAAHRKVPGEHKKKLLLQHTPGLFAAYYHSQKCP